MADYVLSNGTATVLRKDDPAVEAYVDVDLEDLEELSALDADDVLIVQRGSSTPQKVTVGTLGVLSVDLLNQAYLY